MTRLLLNQSTMSLDNDNSTCAIPKGIMGDAGVTNIFFFITGQTHFLIYLEIFRLRKLYPQLPIL